MDSQVGNENSTSFPTAKIFSVGQIVFEKFEVQAYDAILKSIKELRLAGNSEGVRRELVMSYVLAFEFD